MIGLAIALMLFGYFAGSLITLCIIAWCGWLKGVRS